MESPAKHEERFRRIMEYEIPEGDRRSRAALAIAEMLPVQLLIAGLRGETRLDDEQRLLPAEAEGWIAAAEPGKALICLNVLLFGAMPF